MTGKCVRLQFEKSLIDWQNVDWHLVTLYMKMHEKFWEKDELEMIERYLPKR